LYSIANQNWLVDQFSETGNRQASGLLGWLKLQADFNPF
jgi:hypothetical protein